MQEFLSVIRSSTLFSGISEQELTAMLACLGTKASRFPKDALLLRAGDTAESIGLVLSGSVLVEQEDVWGNRNILSKAGPGQTFAAAYACAPGSVLKVSVAAETPATVLFLNVKRVLTMCPSACARHSRIIRNLLGELAEKCCAYDTRVVWTDFLKKDVWAARSAFLTVIEADTKLLDELDVVVPVDRIAEFLVYTRAAGKAEGIAIRNFGHAGDGNLHIYCCANDMELDEFKRRSKAVMDKCYAKCTEFGGQVSGEHAIGHAKKQYLLESVGETAFGLMQAINQVFDPNGLLNPGKVCTNVEEG